MRHSSGCYLAALAISDLIFLPLNILYEVNFSYDKVVLDRPVVCEIYAVLYMSVQHLSPILVLAFTIERYISVCHPFRTSFFSTSNIRATILVILGLVLFCFTLNGVQAYFWTAKYNDNQIMVCMLREELNEKAWTVTTWTIEALISAVVPLTVLLLNILVIIEVRKISNLERKNRQTNSIDRRSTTLMLLGVSFYLIFTLLPVTVIYALYRSYGNITEFCPTEDELRSNSDWDSFFNYWKAKILIQNLGMSHYVANFFIYVATGKIFRNQLKDLLCKPFCEKKLLSISTKTGTFTNSTRTTRMSLTSQRGSLARSKLAAAKTGTDPCNNDTDLCNRHRLGSANSTVDGEMSTMNGGHHPKHEHGVNSRLLTCVEESDAAVDDNDEVAVPMSTLNN
ncbi:probable G-protein coupled receptor 139 [Watersipora subatra]|uniref:probable G-protein coupled receptor 139 n=1 Tax=Watersipora subatra TaxID=2589382 RepID=UPI00355C480B